MLTVRVLPREGVTLRAAVTTVEVTGVLALGHVWAGGTLPSATWLAAMAVVVLGAGLLVLRGRVRPLVALPALVAAQLLLHAWITALTPTATTGGDPLHHHVHAVLDPRMLAVHVAGGLVTAVAWELRTRAVEVVVSWTRQQLPPLPSLRLVPAPVPAPAALLTRFVVSAAPRRGPPVVPAPA
ncbi:hypothetical protein FE634_05405 [Nocardioides dongxiaopingii]|uniref:hypothetical protein n=1 Tax=Nocardioides sp. S-1144 TaxID=2582905 RepID=UPI00110E2B78|nr:hypothetical protein [Nocardioides sp. S-1144]QCW49987.1 hypothetical protein FE634_05405 [Nocardioides sp. S-1144]